MNDFFIIILIIFLIFFLVLIFNRRKSIVALLKKIKFSKKAKIKTEKEYEEITEKKEKNDFNEKKELEKIFKTQEKSSEKINFDTMPNFKNLNYGEPEETERMDFEADFRKKMHSSNYKKMLSTYKNAKKINKFDELDDNENYLENLSSSQKLSKMLKNLPPQIKILIASNIFQKKFDEDEKN